MEVTIALAQYPISYHKSWNDWKNHTTSWINEATKKGAQLLVFPEYGSMELTSLLDEETQQDLHEQISELQSFIPAFIDAFQQLAQLHSCYIVAPSIPFRVGNAFVNRCFVFGPTNYSWQDKHFMTRFENESWGISTSDGTLRLFETPLGKFGIQICYDIEFPVGSHLLSSAGADFILVPSCTETLKGATRVHIGARARALEQQIYTGVSQTIDDALWSPAVDINFGYTAMYASPDGDFPEDGIINQAPSQTAGWLIQTVDLSKNKHIRTEGQVLNYKDSQRSTLAADNLRVAIIKI